MKNVTDFEQGKDQQQVAASRPHVVILGAGFAGLEAAKRLAGADVQITVIDKQNHHLFQPLLYQVASSGLSATEIAQPIRSILADHENIRVLMDEVVSLGLHERCVVTRKGIVRYDYLVVGLGGQTHYFNHSEWEIHAPGLKTIRDAIRIRQEFLGMFETAEAASDPETAQSLMTAVVIGGGPTGVEMAGAFAELTRRVFRSEFRRINPRKSKIILLEGGDRLLVGYSKDSSQAAARQLEKLGVEVRLGAKVDHIGRHEVRVGDDLIRAGTIVWAAGVRAHPLGASLGVATDRMGRVVVRQDLSVPGFPNVFVVGDMARVLHRGGEVVPGVSPAAIQMARHAARIIRDEAGETATDPRTRPEFVYWDKGSMATVGRSAAVAEIGRLRFSGFTAWVAWLAVHLFFLVGLRNRLAVMLQWAYSYFTFKRGARVIHEEISAFDAFHQLAEADRVTAAEKAEFEEGS